MHLTNKQEDTLLLIKNRAHQNQTNIAFKLQIYSPQGFGEAELTDSTPSAR